MTMYFVTVVTPGDKHYMDSIWVDRKNADERSDQLRQELRRSGFELVGGGTETNMARTSWAVKITDAHCLDGQIPAKDEANA